MSVSKFRKIRDKMLAKHAENDKLRERNKVLKEELETAQALLKLVGPVVDVSTTLPTQYVLQAQEAIARWHFAGVPLGKLPSGVLATILVNSMVTSRQGERRTTMANVRVAPGDIFTTDGGPQFIYK